MTVISSSRDHSLTVQVSESVRYRLYPWNDEDFTATARLDRPLNGISPAMQELFPAHTTPENEAPTVFAATLEPSRSDDDLPSKVCAKLARGVDEVVRLRREASVYRKLWKLWGIAVPRMYGLFVGHHDDALVGCLLLELCLGEHAASDATEFIRLAMQSVRKIHTLGTTQNRPLELRHFVMKENRVLLVDFSRAVHHRCNNAMPLYSNQRYCMNREEVVFLDDDHDCAEEMSIAEDNMHAAASLVNLIGIF
ncbi:hypothetical protein BC834DRAFT_311196 [Gloeopeniophorella convolvens]|nr:hypothetical protein BC834DRAFT_311196 [Gloeopeniophorella convolvens]